MRGKNQTLELFDCYLTNLAVDEVAVEPLTWGGSKRSHFSLFVVEIPQSHENVRRVFR